jgi:hypothetical protein
VKGRDRGEGSTSVQVSIYQSGQFKLGLHVLLLYLRSYGRESRRKEAGGAILCTTTTCDHM